MNFLANGGTYKTAKKELYQTLYPDKEIDDDNVDALFNKINSNVMEIVSIVESEKKEDSKNDNNLSIREESKLTLQLLMEYFIKKVMN